VILADTSIWIDHLRKRDSVLEGLLNQGQVLVHPFVIGEIALGHLRQRSVVLSALQNLPKSITANDDEVLRFIDHKALFGQGIGYMDAHLLTSVALTPGILLWTRDKRLRATAIGLSFHAGLT